MNAEDGSESYMEVIRLRNRLEEAKIRINVLEAKESEAQKEIRSLYLKIEQANQIHHKEMMD